MISMTEVTKDNENNKRSYAFVKARSVTAPAWHHLRSMDSPREKARDPQGAELTKEDMSSMPS